MLRRELDYHVRWYVVYAYRVRDNEEKNVYTYIYIKIRSIDGSSSSSNFINDI